MEVKERIFELPDITISAIQFGEGDHTFIALHGWLDNAMSFAPLAPYLTQHNISIIALDLAGHGRSGHRPPGSGYHFTDYMRDVIFIADQLGLAQFNLLCHSMGAAIGTLIAGTFPQRVRQLICIDLYGVPFTSDTQSITERFESRLCKMSYQEKSIKKHYSNIERLVDARENVSAIKRENAQLIIERNLKKDEDGYYFTSDKRLAIWQPMILSEDQMLAFCKRICADVLVIEANNGYAPKWLFLNNRYKNTANITIKKLDGGHHLHMDEAERVANEIVIFIT